MARVEHITCLECLKKCSISVGSGQVTPSLCGECVRKAHDTVRQAHFKMLDNLTMEERLRRVEKWTYDYKVPINPMNVLF